MRCPRFLWISLGPLKEGTQSFSVPRKNNIGQEGMVPEVQSSIHY